MIKFKHLVALSITAAVAVNASAEDAKVTISGSVSKPTCTISVDVKAVDLGKVSASSFKEATFGGDTYKVSGEGTKFSIEVTDADAIKVGNEGAVCQSISMLSSDSPNGLPQINIKAAAKTTNGFLTSTEAAAGSNLGFLIVDSADKQVKFGEDLSAVRELQDIEQGKMSFKAYFAAIESDKKIQEQEITNAVMTFTVSYN